jgi:hypothetical protein
MCLFTKFLTYSSFVVFRLQVAISASRANVSVHCLYLKCKLYCYSLLGSLNSFCVSWVLVVFLDRVNVDSCIVSC